MIELDKEERIRSIVNRVMEKIETEKKRTALIVFTGGASGFNESLAQLRKMLANNWKLKVVLSTSAAYIFTPALIKSELGIDDVYLESENTGLRPLYEDASILIIPTLTTNTVAKIACGITDNMALNLLSHFIMTNSPVVVANDAFDLSHTDRAQLNMGQPPSAYRKLFENHLRTIESFGVKVVKALDIYQGVQEMIIPDSSVKPDIPAKQTCLPNKIVSKADIIENKETSKEIIVKGNAIVTPLAMETAKKFGLEIKRDEDRERM